MEKAKKMGAGALAITGNIDFYEISGFVPDKTKGVRYVDDPEYENEPWCENIWLPIKSILRLF